MDTCTKFSLANIIKHEGICWVHGNSCSSPSSNLLPANHFYFWTCFCCQPIKEHHRTLFQAVTNCSIPLPAIALYLQGVLPSCQYDLLQKHQIFFPFTSKSLAIGPGYGYRRSSLNSFILLPPAEVLGRRVDRPAIILRLWPACWAGCCCWGGCIIPST